MSKIIVNEGEYIEVLNEALQGHRLYEEGMEVFGVPQGSTKLSGYNWNGPDNMRSILAQVVADVNKEYELVVE